MLRANYHTHTCFCDGRDLAEDMVKEAINKGFSCLGFSGHMDADIHMDMGAYTMEIRRLQEKYRGKLDILLGVELDNLYDPSCAKEAEYIIGSTHFLDVDSEIPMSVDSTEGQMETLCREFYGGDYYRLCRAYYELEAKVYDRLHCTFVGHFDLVTRFNDSMRFVDETDRRYLDPALEAMEYLVSEGVPFEINCGAVNRGRKADFYPCGSLLKALRKFNGRILISSDAHQKELLSGAFPEAVRQAMACGFTHTLLLKHDDRGKIIQEEVPLDLL